MSEEQEIVVDFGDDAQVQGEQAEGLFKLLREKVLALVKADSDVLAAEEEVIRARHRSAQLREREIPELMSKMGATKIAHGDIEVELEKVVHGGMPSYDKDPAGYEHAIKWLQDNGHGAMVKDIIAVPLSTDSEDEAVFLRDWLQAQGYEFNEKPSVHPSTFKKWMREMMEAGKPLPTEMFNIHEQKLAKISVGGRTSRPPKKR